MRKYLLLLLLFIPILIYAAGADNKLHGRILLQVEDAGQAWYVEPGTGERAFLGRPQDAFNIMRELGLGVSEHDFEDFAGTAPSHLSGKILLRAEASGEAYYVNPLDMKMHYLGRPADAFRVMRELGLGIKTSDLQSIKMDSRYGEKISQKINVDNKELVNIYFFHGDGCPHCTKAEIFLDKLQEEYSDLNIVKYETWKNKDNKAFYNKVKEEYDLNTPGVPLTLIGDEYVYGYGGDKTSGEQIKNYIEVARNGEKVDLVFPLLENVYKVLKVVDGDTLDVDIFGEKKRIRIIGVDTPEIVAPNQPVECYGKEASDMAKELLEDQYVRIEYDASQGNTDKYDRLLRHIFLSDGRNVAKLLVAGGYAEEKLYGTKHIYTDDYQETERQAVDDSLGMWGACDL